jgi:hypothetical protein
LVVQVIVTPVVVILPAEIAEIVGAVVSATAWVDALAVPEYPERFPAASVARTR